MEEAADVCTFERAPLYGAWELFTGQGGKEVSSRLLWHQGASYSCAMLLLEIYIIQSLLVLLDAQTNPP